MTAAEILPYLDHLEDNLDSLEESLTTFFLSNNSNNSLATTAKKLPLVDRAKLHVTVVYAIESLIFSYLRLHEVSPHSHPVFKELARVKSYFSKIKEVEDAPAAASKKPDVSLDKNAAGRVIKHALAGNRKIDLEAAEKKAREALLAKRRLKAIEQAAVAASTAAASVPLSSPMSAPSRSLAHPPHPSSDVAVGPGEDAQGGDGDGDDMEEGEIEESQLSPPPPADSPTKTSNKTQKLSKKERKRQREAEAKANGSNGVAAAGTGEAPRQAKKKRKNSSVAATTTTTTTTTAAA